MSKQPQVHPDSEQLVISRRSHHIFRLRRYTFAEWCGWIIWLMALGILLEYAITSFAEDERQAGVVAGVIAFGLLLAKIIIEVMKTVDLNNKYHNTSSSVELDNDPEP